MRKCGECRACCRLLGPGGCTVHGGAGQPEVCRLYACWWLEHEGLPDALRPDRVGLVVTESGAAAVGGLAIPVLVVNMLEPGSEDSPAARGMLAEFTAAGAALFLLRGADLRVVYDRSRYPGIGPDDIEAAFKRERVRDAEELRRLGAVDEDSLRG